MAAQVIQVQVVVELIRAAVDHPVAQVPMVIRATLALEATELRLAVQALRVIHR